MAKVAAVRFKAVVLLLLFHSLLLVLLFVWVLIVCVGFVLGPCFVMQYSMTFLLHSSS